MSHLPLNFGPQICGEPIEGTAREWIVADGCGGYAMGTACGLRTRRYHGLLMVAGSHPGERRLALAALDPSVDLHGTEIALGAHEWASGAIAPTGYDRLESFGVDADGLPVWRWRIGETVIERRLAMRHGSPTLGIVHSVVTGPPVTLTLRALGTWRDQHGERFASGPAPLMQEVADGVVVESAYRLAGPNFVPDGTWWYGAHLREEAARGLAATEDLWSIGTFGARLHAGEAIEITAWAGDLAAPPPPARKIIAAERTRRAAIRLRAGTRDGVDATLALAADQFVIAGPDVVAGYPWFGAWSRDTMISYEGLFLTANRADEGRELLLRYAAALSEGMLPNTADTSRPGAVDFHSIDAPLWFIHAVGRHVAATGDADLAAALLPALISIVDAYDAGTRFGIGTDRRGLLAGGTPDSSLTWMDARVDGRPVTSRSGLPVEINALWINALGTMISLVVAAGAFGERDCVWFATRRDATLDAFIEAFPAGRPYLPDVLTTAGPDLSLRPNQVLAYGLPFAPLHGTAPGPAVASALLTPLGLRTLAPDDPAYLGRHEGDARHRDLGYHQGTVWPWLTGPYAAALRAADVPAHGLLDGVIAHLGAAGLGSISETACGDAPHTPTGCPFQAWSVAQTWTAYRLLTS